MICMNRNGNYKTSSMKINMYERRPFLLLDPKHRMWE